MAKVKKPREVLWTPVGRYSYPFFVTPDSGRQYSDDKYKCDFLIPKSIFKETGKALQDAVLKVGREFFGGKFEMKSGKWHIPFKDTDTVPELAGTEQAGCILIRAKSTRKPIFLAARKDESGKFPELTSEQVAELKGGDWGVLNLTCFPYEQSGGGISFGLNGVQFWKEGEGFGQGRSRLLETAEELEAEIEDVTDVVIEEESII